MVLYTDGSFRQGKAGWGVHGYTYKDVVLTTKTANKQQPTSKGYFDVPLEKTCTVVDYIDAYGPVLDNPTNNTAELSAAINGFEIAKQHNVSNLTMWMDSEYVRKGITDYVTKWAANGWVKVDGNPVANRGYWEKLLQLKNDWNAAGHQLSLQWVKGHSDDLGNDKADANAVLGGGSKTPTAKVVVIEAESVNKLKKKPVNALILESRLLCTVGKEVQPDGYYYMYNLGRMHSYGGKPRDTKLDKLVKSDLLLGRRISEATFGVFKAKEPEEYLDTVVKMHCDRYGTEVDQLAIVNLLSVFNKNTRHRIETVGIDGLQQFEEHCILATPDDVLVSMTLVTPRLAYEAVNMFGILQRQLDEFLEAKTGTGVDILDVTEHFFETIEGKKVKHQLLKSITTQTQAVEIPFEYKGHKIKAKLVLGIDIPGRNQLNRIGQDPASVHLLVTCQGPNAYSFSTVFKTEDGTAIYASPYTQFILPKKQVSHED